MRAGLRLPYEVIRELPRWRRLVDLVAGFYADPLRPEDGCSEEELANLEARLGRLPDAVAEWFLLVGQRLRPPLDADQVYRLSQVTHHYTPPGLLDLYANDCGGWGLGAPLGVAEEDPPGIDYAISRPERQYVLGPVSECLLNVVAKQTAWSFGGRQSLLGPLAPTVVAGQLRAPPEERVGELRRLAKTNHEGPDGRSPDDLPEVRSDFSSFVALVELHFSPGWIRYVARDAEVRQLELVARGAESPLVSAEISPGSLVATLTGLERRHFLELVDLEGPDVQRRQDEVAQMLRRSLPQTVEERQAWGGSTVPAEVELRRRLGPEASIRVEHSRAGEDLLVVVEHVEPRTALLALRAGLARTGSLQAATVSADPGRFRLVAYEPPAPASFVIPESLERLFDRETK